MTAEIPKAKQKGANIEKYENYSSSFVAKKAERVQWRDRIGRISKSLEFLSHRGELTLYFRLKGKVIQL